MATELTEVKFNGTTTYFAEDGTTFDHCANVHVGVPNTQVNYPDIQITEPSGVQQGTFERAVEQDDGTVHVLGTLTRKNNAEVEAGADAKIEIVFGPVTREHPQGSAGYTFTVGQPVELAMISVAVDKLEYA